MNSVEDAPTESPATPVPAPLPPGSRPDHTIFSILILLLLAAGALYLVDWVLRDDGNVVQSWDFTLPLDGTWEFPDPEAHQTDNGIVFEMKESGFGPKRAFDIPADTVNRIQATINVTQVETGKPVRFALGWYWAREPDMVETPDAPFAANRAMAFFSFARHRPDTYRVNMNTHELWNGTINAGVFTLKFPADATGPFRVTLSRLEFLE